MQNFHILRIKGSSIIITTYVQPLIFHKSSHLHLIHIIYELQPTQTALMSKRTHSFTPDDAPFSFNSFFQDPKGSKRKRVTRACDECHKKKVKCDGKQPCLHCSVYSYPCTYNKPTKRKISALNQFKSTIEMQMNNVRAVLNLLMPKVNVFDEEFNLEEFQEVCKDLKTDQNKFLKKLQTEYKRRNGDDDNDNDDNDNDNDDDEEEGEEVGEGARGNPKKKRRLEEISIATDDTPSTFCLSSPDADMVSLFLLLKLEILRCKVLRIFQY